MAVIIKVCTGGSCGSKGGKELLRDIEELCQLRVACEPRGCMGKCAKGPNVEVVEDEGRPKASTGIQSFAKVEALLSSLAALDFAPSQLDLEIGQLKYKARRTTQAEERMRRIEEAFRLMGGEDLASQQPLNAAALFVLRSKELLKLDTGRALQDAEFAVRLWADWPQALLAHGTALELLGRFPEALVALERAMHLRRGLDLQRTSGQIQRLRRKAAQAGPPTAKADSEVVVDATSVAVAPASSTVAEVVPPPKERPAEDLPPYATPTHGLHVGLYEDFGGQKALAEFVSGFYDKMGEDENLGKFFARFTMENLKGRTVDYMAGQWGGPEYHGPNLFTAHAALHLTENQWSIMMKAINSQLKKMGVSKALKQRVIAQVEEMKKPIIDPTGEFLEWIQKKYQQLEGGKGTSSGGVSLSVSKDKLDAWKAAEDRRKQRAQQLALIKAKREQEEAAAKAAAKAIRAAAPIAKKPAEAQRKVADKRPGTTASPKRAARPLAKAPGKAAARSTGSLSTTAGSDAFLRSGESVAPVCFLPEEPIAEPPSSAAPRLLSTLAL